MRAGYDAAETRDEDPERVAALRALVWAYLRTTLYPGDSSWSDALETLNTMPNPPGKVDGLRELTVGPALPAHRSAGSALAGSEVILAA